MCLFFKYIQHNITCFIAPRLLCFTDVALFFFLNKLKAKPSTSKTGFIVVYNLTHSISEAFLYMVNLCKHREPLFLQKKITVKFATLKFKLNFYISGL